MFKELKTNRLKLRPIHEGDSEIIFEKWTQDEDVSKYMTWTPHKKIQETEQFIMVCSDGWSQNSYTWIIETKNTGKVIGCFAARLEKHKVDIGYLIIKSEWSKGYMTEVITAFITEAFKNEKINRIWAVCDVENIASKGVLEKAGMECEGILKSWLVHPNMSLQPRDCHCLSIVKNV